MGFYGNLNTMSVPELLGWVEVGRKTGTLEVENDKIIKRIMFQSGRMVGCSSNDPATLMGQFLLARGAITREVLSQAMRRQEQSEKNLGAVLIEMGAIEQAHQDAFVAAKIDETIYGLFDWAEAVFRFHTDAQADSNAVELDLGIPDVIEKGMRRSAERELLREVIDDPGIVLRRTAEDEPAEILASQAARRIYGLIDGNKTVKEILLHSHAPEFMVTKFLTALVQSESVEVVEVKTEPGEVEAAEDPAAELLFDDLLDSVDSIEPETTAEAPPELGVSPEDRREYHALANKTPQDSRELQQEINVALQLLSGGRPEAALELLNAMTVAHPADLSLRQLVNNAERDFCKQTLDNELSPTHVPTRTRASEGVVKQEVSAEESFMLEQIDGVTDIKALLWVSPMREVDSLRTLRRMIGRGWIEVRQAA